MSATHQQLVAALNVFQEALFRVEIQVEADGGGDPTSLASWVTKLADAFGGL